jgi:Ca2+-binding RTX toxin-like protein
VASNTVETGDASKGHISGSGGNDTIDAGGGSDLVAGDHNGSFVSASGGNDVLDGGAGDDFVNGDSLAPNLVSGASGNDAASGGGGGDFVVGDSMVLSCEGRMAAPGGNDSVNGGAGDDAPLIGDHFLICGVPTARSGNDTLSGESGNDGLHGDNYTDTGDPVFDSGEGRDRCLGGVGTDSAALRESVVGVP